MIVMLSFGADYLSATIKRKRSKMKLLKKNSFDIDSIHYITKALVADIKP